jgi:hypothetical protein
MTPNISDNQEAISIQSIQPFGHGSRRLLTQYGLSLDIFYDDPAFPVANKHSQVYYWNQST